MKAILSKIKVQASRPDASFERKHRSDGRLCIGIDEVGRGCLAGPVVTAAVLLPDFILESAGDGSSENATEWWHQINDSKKIPPAQREKLAELIWKNAQVQVSWCLPEEIDEWNILHAAMIAMRRASWAFSGLVQAVLIDGNQNPFAPRYRCPPDQASRLGFTQIETLVKGDQRSISIAAASIVAKVYRDRWMVELDRVFPGYGFAGHKGYSTPIHYAALEKLGPTPLHRRSFEPIKSLLS